MAEDQMRYDQLAQNALRGVVREALRRAEVEGLPGEHHFYVAFNTRYPGVDISPRIQERYPREMTIVIQHQYWNLKVYEAYFEVELSFDNVTERLVIPFNAVKGFLDPAVQFGLQFEVVVQQEDEEPAKNELADDHKTATEGSEDPAPANEDTKVVSLDAFRKK
jgi:uncharacterized protein